MSHNLFMRRIAPVLAAAALGLSALVACSEEDPADQTTEETEQTEETAENGENGTEGAEDEETEPETVDGLPVPDGVDLTEEGSELQHGDRARVAYSPEQGKVTALMLRVRKVERTDWRTSFEGWKPLEEQNVTPYFVRANVRNIGESGMARKPVPLYAADGDGRLFEASAVEGDFEPCSPARLPKPFGPNADPTSVCLVYLLPQDAELSEVVFRPTQQYEAITWTGEIDDIRKNQGGNGGGDGGGNGDGDGGGDEG